MSDEINYVDLIYYFKGLSSPLSFTEYEDLSDLSGKNNRRRRANKIN